MPHEMFSSVVETALAATSGEESKQQQQKARGHAGLARSRAVPCRRHAGGEFLNGAGAGPAPPSQGLCRLLAGAVPAARRPRPSARTCGNARCWFPSGRPRPRAPIGCSGCRGRGGGVALHAGRAPPTCGGAAGAGGLRAHIPHVARVLISAEPSAARSLKRWGLRAS